MLIAKKYLIQVVEVPPALTDVEMQPNSQLSDDMQGSEEDQEWAELPANSQAKNYDVPSAVILQASTFNFLVELLTPPLCACRECIKLPLLHTKS